MKIFNNLQNTNYKQIFSGRKKEKQLLNDVYLLDVQGLTPSQKQKLALDFQIRDFLKAGLTVKEICQCLKISHSTVSRTAKKLNIPLNKPQKRLERDQLILQKITNGESNKKIMEDLNISYSPINAIKKNINWGSKKNKLKSPYIIYWHEIIDESKKIAKLQDMHKRFKKGERTKALLEEMSKLVDEIKTTIDSFKQRLEN